MSPENLSLILTLISTSTLFVLAISGLIYARRFLHIYSEKESSGAAINITNTPRENNEAGGFVFVPVKDDHKTIFMDAMSGFADFAKLRGYRIDISMDSSLPGKVGIRFIILDAGITVSVKTVQNDVDEYIRRLRKTDDFSDMPFVINRDEHSRLVSALQMRMTMLRGQIEILSITNEHYKNLLRDLHGADRRGIGYHPSSTAQHLSLTVQTQGGSTMGDSLNANNSQGIAQGKNASANVENSRISIGSTHKEMSSNIDLLKDFEKLLSNSNLELSIKKNTSRYVENAIEEMENNEKPQPDQVKKWLDKTKSSLSAASAGADLFEKLKSIFDKFGLPTDDWV